MRVDNGPLVTNAVASARSSPMRHDAPMASCAQNADAIARTAMPPPVNTIGAGNFSGPPSGWPARAAPMETTERAGRQHESDEDRAIGA